MLPVVIILIGWLLSERYFPAYTVGYIPEVNYILGGIASLMLTFSILFHELGHALAAVRSKLSIDRIHLLLFGGMAELKHRPQTGFQELGVALSGPLASLILGGLTWMAVVYLPISNDLIVVLLQFVVHINVLLAIFNLIPIFPLDGGRAARAIIWQLIGKYQQASMAALKMSYLFIALIFLIGLVDVFTVFSSYALLTLLLAAYLTYTIFNGRRELVHKPEFIDLLYRLEHQDDIIATVRQIKRSDSRYLPRTTLPILKENHLQAVVLGKSLHNHQIFDDSPDSRQLVNDLQIDPAPGNYIDLSNPDTYHKNIRFHSDYVPVLQRGYFLGLCDANELRFWLNEKDLYNPDKPYNPDDVIPESYCE